MSDPEFEDKSWDRFDDECDWDESDFDSDEVETLPCPSCGQEIYEEAQRCPECGAYMTPGSALRVPAWIWVGVTLGLVAMLGTLVLNLISILF